MDGNFKKGLIIINIIIGLISCNPNRQDFQFESKEILRNNFSILVDSVEYFNWTKIPVTNKFNNIEKKEFRVELIDSITIEKESFQFCKDEFSKKTDGRLVLQKILIDKSMLDEFKVKDISITNKNSNDIYTLTIIFSNLIIDESINHASIVVTKKVGISMKKDLFLFEKRNNVWVYLNRKNVSIG